MRQTAKERTVVLSKHDHTSNISHEFLELFTFMVYPAMLAPSQDSAGASARSPLPSKKPRPTLRPHTAPAVVKAREAALPKRETRPPEFASLLVDAFSSGKTSATQVLWLCRQT